MDITDDEDVISVDSEGDTEDRAVLISDTEEDVIFVKTDPKPETISVTSDVSGAAAVPSGVPEALNLCSAARMLPESARTTARLLSDDLLGALSSDSSLDDTDSDDSSTDSNSLPSLPTTPQKSVPKSCPQSPAGDDRLPSLPSTPLKSGTLKSCHHSPGDDTLLPSLPSSPESTTAKLNCDTSNPTSAGNLPSFTHDPSIVSSTLLFDDLISFPQDSAEDTKGKDVKDRPGGDGMDAYLSSSLMQRGLDGVATEAWANNAPSSLLTPTTDTKDTQNSAVTSSIPPTSSAKSASKTESALKSGTPPESLVKSTTQPESVIKSASLPDKDQPKRSCDSVSSWKVPPKKRRLPKKYNRDSKALPDLTDEVANALQISDDDDDDIQIVEGFEKCTFCERLVLHSKLLACSCGKHSCGPCLEKQVTNILAKGEKGLPKCSCSECDLVFEFEKLSDFLPPMVMGILRKKVDEEIVGDIVEWLKPAEEQTPERTDIEKALDLPSGWTPMPEGLDFLLVTLTPESGEYINIHNHFHLTMHSPRAQIQSIKRVQNHSLWRFYAMKRYLMQLDEMFSWTVENTLFHGTRKQHTEAICRDNFDWRMCGVSHGTAYGMGSYFAQAASFSHRYTDQLPAAMMIRAKPPAPPPPPPAPPNLHFYNIQHGPLNLTAGAPVALNGVPLYNALYSGTPGTMPSYLPPPPSYRQQPQVIAPMGSTHPLNSYLTAHKDPLISSTSEAAQEPPKHIHCMFIAKVLTGKYTMGRANFRKPPPIDENCKNSKFYDSCVNNTYNPTIFVVFDKAQCYPEYVIEYTNQFNVVS